MNSLENFTGNAQRKPVVDEINDYDGSDIREILTGAGVVIGGDEITADDYESIKKRARVLADEINVPISANALLLGAYADRMENLGRATDNDFKDMPNDVVRSIMYARTGYSPNDVEIELIRTSNFPINKEWVDEREQSKKGVSDYSVAVDEKATVVGSGGTPEEAVRQAQIER